MISYSKWYNLTLYLLIICCTICHTFLTNHIHQANPVFRYSNSISLGIQEKPLTQISQSKNKHNLHNPTLSRSKKSPLPSLPEKPIHFQYNLSTPTLSFSPKPFLVQDSVKTIAPTSFASVSNDLFKEKLQRMNIEPITLLTLGTTIIQTKDAVKRTIQENCLKVLNSFYPYVKTVVFDKNPPVSIPNSHLHFEASFEANEYGTPFFKSMMVHLEEHYQSPFYGYCNGDLLFHSSFVATLATLFQRLQSGELKQRTFIVGRRVNYDRQNIQPISSNITEQDQYIEECAKDGYLFQTDAEDYFIFTKGTLPWQEIKNVIIGRPGYDNYLVHYVYYRRHLISLVDTTNSILIVHQTDKDGNKAGFRNNPDRNWNLHLIGNDWWMGRTEFTPLALEITPKGEYRMQHREVNGVRCDDDYLQQELDILQRYIKPTDICLQTIHRATTGVLLQYCKEVFVVIWDGRIYNQLRKVYEKEPRMHIIFGTGFENPNSQIHSLSYFRQYADLAVKNKGVTVFINDGRIKPQLAYMISFFKEYIVFLMDAFMIVFDTAKQQNRHYSIIRQFYSLEKDYNTPLIPGQEFSGITIYKNTQPTNSVLFPSWW